MNDMTAPRHKTKISWQSYQVTEWFILPAVIVFLWTGFCWGGSCSVCTSLLIAVNVFDIDLKAISVSWLEGIRLHDPLAPWVFLNATLKVWHRKLMYQFLSLPSSSQLAQHQTSLNLCKALRCWHFSMDPSSGWGWGIRTDQLSTSSIFTRDVGCCLCISWQF